MTVDTLRAGAFSRAAIIVSAGGGVGNSENIVLVTLLANAPIGDVACSFAGGYRFEPILLTNFPLQLILTLSGRN